MNEYQDFGYFMRRYDASMVKYLANADARLAQDRLLESIAHDGLHDIYETNVTRRRELVLLAD